MEMKARFQYTTDHLVWAAYNYECAFPDEKLTKYLVLEWLKTKFKLWGSKNINSECQKFHQDSADYKTDRKLYLKILRWVESKEWEK